MQKKIINKKKLIIINERQLQKKRILSTNCVCFFVFFLFYKFHAFFSLKAYHSFNLNNFFLKSLSLSTALVMNNLQSLIIFNFFFA